MNKKNPKMENLEEKEIEIRKKIDAYLNGEMSVSEQESFWDLVISNSEIYHSLKVEASARVAYKQERNSKIEVLDEQILSNPDNKASQLYDKPIFAFSDYKNWVIAVAAVLVLVVGINIFKINSPTNPESRAHILTELTLIPSIDLFSVEALDAFRSDTVVDDAFAMLFDQSLVYLFTDKPNEALALFQELLETFPEDSRIDRAIMNMGIIHYNLEDYTLAALFFEDAIQITEDDRRLEKAWWYKANSELIIGDYEMARYSFYVTFELDGVFRREAFRQLQLIEAYLGYIDLKDIQ